MAGGEEKEKERKKKERKKGCRFAQWMAQILLNEMDGCGSYEMDGCGFYETNGPNLLSGAKKSKQANTQTGTERKKCLSVYLCGGKKNPFSSSFFSPLFVYKLTTRRKDKQLGTQRMLQ